jgi:hypothetical protein
VEEKDRGSTMVAVRKRPTRESVLSTLVHRAVGMPWQRLQVIDGGRRVFRGEVFEMAEEIKSAAAELKEAFSLRREEVAADWSRARLMADAGGPWSDACVDEFLQVSGSRVNRRWILNNLMPATATLADFLQETAREEGWRAIWAEVPLLIGPETPRHTIKKVDQIIFLEGPNCFLSELKVTTRPYDSWPSPERHDLQRLRQCRKVLNSPGFKIEGCYLLLADAYGERRPTWIRVELGTSPS